MIPPRPKNKNNFNQWLNKYFSIILAGVLILFLALAYLVFLGPKFTATKDIIQANITEQENLYALSQQKLANLQAVGTLYKTIKEADLQKFDSVLPDNYIPARLFGELEEIINSGGWLLTEINIEQAPPGDINKNVGQINVELSLSGLDYIDFKRLLKILETDLRLLDVTNVSLDSASNSVTLMLTTYYYQTAN
ncbi:hypothetical protein GW920_00170 [Candidatus Falkowbacteria bacterium]|uniref:Type 4a pilus biogenesis protein PilO n=1 Tax=Candidatus Falkowbacteria bacterium CG10_big_fil_rev_8_21_14_0_10_37_18 TaxID=1974562 RepID=A0A2H0V9N9_9BACT|nr:hypothetical protein [Candidatus Falkowbacteria bacterium]NCQ12868.1 hypothetical protein [Candidatus Falkowbacteria bacterium]OIO05456.1 MAG: hypothetical protein AUJ26_03205 [Candidatus Falkowbacteria bacterium CG1_02_37_21]PIR95773.1 MAG: hypothetical protein COT93_00565 [Candidatus Falkowbacteria bacterium CG10_big_fil_rev_8_21_14_0_10_37_18]